MNTSDRFTPARPAARKGWRPKVIARTAHGTVAETSPPTPAELEGHADLAEALRRGEERERALWSVVSEFVFCVERGGTIKEFHGPSENEFLVTAETLVGRRVTELLPAAMGQMALHYLEKTLRTQQPQVFSFHHNLPNRVRVFEVRTAPCDANHVFAAAHDATNREWLEKELADSSHRIQSRIGQDLHDSLGQHLTGITFLTKALERKLTALKLPEAAEAAEIGQQVLAALSQTRHLARGLFPVEVETQGLVAGLRELAVSTQEIYRIQCAVECDEGLEISDSAAATHLFRLAQEAVLNAVRHGQARHIALHLSATEERCTFQIIDDGIGIAADEITTKGLGLRIMAYRAQKVGGTLQVRRGEHGGTTVSCTFPQVFPAT